MTVGELLGGGFNVLKRRPKELIIWTVIQLVVSVAFIAAFIPYMTSAMQAQQQALASGAPTLPTIPAGIGLFLLAYLLILVWFLMMFTAVVRAAANTGEDKAAWLRFGGDELRLIGLGLLYIVATIVVWMVLAMVIGALIAALAYGSPSTAGIIGIIVGIICFCAAVWLWVRLSLVGAVFVLERSFALRKGWQATKGHFWTLFGTYLIMAVAYFIFQMIVVMITSPALIGTMFGGVTDPQQALERQRQMIASLASPGVGMTAIWIVGTLIGTVAVVYYFGVIATAAISATGYSRQDLAELESHFE